MSATDSQIQATGVLKVFGFDDTPVTVTVIPRSVQWRGLRAAAFLLTGMVLGSAMAIFPPHVLWPLLGIGVGGTVGLLRWKERFTLVELTAACPKCGESIRQTGPGRFQPEGSVDCGACRHTSRIQLADGALPR